MLWLSEPDGNRARSARRCSGTPTTPTATRLQTLDHGAPVSLYKVSRELGHSSTAMVQSVYAHLGDVRHRSEQVEFRIEQHAEKLGERLESLKAAAQT